MNVSLSTNDCSVRGGTGVREYQLAGEWQGGRVIRAWVSLVTD